MPDSPHHQPLKVAVTGATGRLGSAAVQALNAAAEFQVVATLGRGDDASGITESGATHLLELSVPEASFDWVNAGLAAGAHCVVGTTGWDEQQRQRLAEIMQDYPEQGVLIAPNFALGSVLASRYAAAAARYFDSVEIMELHHPRKVDAPSGTAIRTAELIAQERARHGCPPAPDATEKSLPGARGADVSGVPVHALRIQGLTAHQEVIFGGAGETLRIRHDSFGYDSFMHGIQLALRTVASRPGLAYGLDQYLEI